MRMLMRSSRRHAATVCVQSLTFMTPFLFEHRAVYKPYQVSSARPAAEYILTSEGAHTPFSVISPLRAFGDGSRLYKLFSAAPLDDALLRALFRNATRVAERDWAAAYPRFGAPEAFAPFQLAEVCAARCPQHNRQSDA